MVTNKQTQIKKKHLDILLWKLKTLNFQKNFKVQTTSHLPIDKNEHTLDFSPADCQNRINECSWCLRQINFNLGIYN